MRLINRTLTNGDALAEPNARHWQGLEAWRIGIHGALPLRRRFADAHDASTAPPSPWDRP